MCILRFGPKFFEKRIGTCSRVPAIHHQHFSPRLPSLHGSPLLLILSLSKVRLFFIMLRRQFLQQSRAISKSFTELRQVRRSPFSSATIISPRATTSAALPSRLQRRWQSVEAQQENRSSDAGPSEDAKSAEVTPDPLKEELEKSKKEIIDLKVDHHTAHTLNTQSLIL